jgi:hypothetical protein
VRPRSLARFLAIPVAAAGIAAGAAVVAPAVAQAQTVNLDTSGTVTVTVPLSYIEQLAKAGIVEFPVPLSELSASRADKTVTVTFKVTGGDADISVFAGQVDLSGSVEIAGLGFRPRVVTLKGLELDVANGQIDGTPAHCSTPVVLLDLGGSVSFTSTQSTTNSSAFTDTYDSSELTVDPAGASYLDGALHTKAFQAGQDAGSMAATWSLVYP